jgi:hypothetical protein
MDHFERLGLTCAGQNLRKIYKKPYIVQMVNGGQPRPTKIIVLIKNKKYEATFSFMPSIRIRTSAIWWYRFQNPPTFRDIGLKFDMGVVFGKLEDVMHDFLPGTVHK